MLKYKTTNLVFAGAFFLLMVISRFWPLPFIAYAILILLYGILHVYGSTVLSMEFFLPVRWCGSRQSNTIALTFDDGPLPGATERILEILKTNNVKAAFFCIGHRINENPGLVQQLHDAGHVVGNHSYWHGRMFDLQTTRKIEQELADTDAVIEKTIRVKPAFFRPPYGVSNPMVARAVKNRGYKAIGWSVRSFDTVIHNADRLFDRVTRSLRGGDVVLFHDYSLTTLEILPAFLDYISKKGLKIVRLDELLNEKAYA
jgi:peptidoglycan/xylan/chitin deacetylase (PgdA/CDA1 family)